MRENSDIRRVNILGVGIHTTSPEDAVERLETAVERGEKGYICVTGVHGVMESQRDYDLRDIHNRSYLTVPDGMPLVWLGKLEGNRQMARTYGPDLMLDVMKATAKSGHSHFFYGGKEGVADELKLEMERRFPGVQISGTYCPPFRPLTEEEEEVLANRIAELKPDYLWVGLSTPKQERFMAGYLNRLEVHMMLGVGAAFDLHTGRMIDAPRWMKKMGLQWLHRLCQEPRRLGPRYLLNNPLFIWKTLLQRFRFVRYEL